MMTLLTIFLATLLKIILSQDSSDVIIFRISNNPADDVVSQTSSLGGTTFYVKGSGFSPDLDNNIVLVGGKKAQVTGANLAFLTFQSPPWANETDAPVVIVVSNPSTNTIKNSICKTNCNIYYRWGFTPELFRMVPRSAGPMEYINFYGSANVPNSESITDIKIGEFICDRAALDPDEYDGYGWQQLYMCRVAPETVAGYYNSTFITIKGSAKRRRDFGSIAYSTKTYYDFKCYPIIHSINTNIFSSEGGIITIYGYGFSLNLTNNTVKIGDYPCNILEADSYTIKCEVKFATKASNLLPIRTKGNGIEKWLYDARNSPLFEITTGRFRDFFFTNSSKIGLPLISYTIESEFDRFVTTDTVENAILEAWMSYFRAPATGMYRFYLSNDDGAELLISTKANSPDSQFLTRIAYDYNYNSYNLPYYRDTQVSAAINLVKDSFYLISGFRRQGWGETHMLVGVEVPFSEQNSISIPSVQKIEIKYEKVIREEIQIEISNFKNIGRYIITLEARTVSGSVDFYKETVALDFNAIAGTVRGTLVNNLGWDGPTVELLKYNSSGLITVAAYDNTTIRILYKIKFATYRSDRLRVIVPKLGVKQYDSNDPNTKITIQTTVEPSPPISGNFTLKLGDVLLDPIPGNVDRIGDYMINKLGLDRGVYIDRSSYINDEHYYLIKLSGLTGSIPLFTVLSNDLNGGVPGTKPIISITNVITGSNNIFYSPVPSDLLYTVYNETNPNIHHVTVESNGIAGRCRNITNCTVKIDLSLTPIIDGFFISDQGILNIHLKELKLKLEPNNLTITLGKAPCSPVILAAPLNVTCSLAKNPDNTLMMEAGSHKPVVHLENFGYFLLDPKLISYEVDLQIKSLLSGQSSMKGGLTLTLNGNHLPLSLFSSFSLLVSSSPCPVISTSATSLTFRTPPLLTKGQQPLKLTTNSKDIDCGSITYDPSYTPNINSVTPNSASPAQKTELVIAGSGFGIDKSKIKVFLDTEKVNGVYEISTLQVTNTEIRAILGGGRSGTYTLRVELEGLGSSAPSTSMANIITYEITITKVTVMEGSKEGGTVIGLEGTNFSPILSQNQVFIGDELNKYCDILKATAVYLECRTRKETGFDLIGKNQVIYVTQRVREEAVCKVIGGCVFKFSNEKTPVINNSANLTLKMGEEGVLNGVNLDVTDSNGNVYVEILSNGIVLIKLKASTSTSTQVKFIMPALVADSYKIRVLVENKGYATISDSLNLITPLILSSITLNQGKLDNSAVGSRGGLVIGLIGNGFSPDDDIFLNTTTIRCFQISTSPTAKTCITPIFSSDKQKWQVFIYRNKILNATCAGCFFTVDQSDKRIITSVVESTSNLKGDFILSLIGRNIYKVDGGKDPIPYLEVVDQVNFEYTNRLIGTYKLGNTTYMQIEFAKIPQGIYKLNVYFEEFGFALFSTQTQRNLVIGVNDLNIDKTVSTLNGGKPIVITGNYFPTDMKLKPNIYNITACGRLCEIQTNDLTSVTCKLPMLVTNQSLIKYFNDKSAYGFVKDYYLYSDAPASQININDDKVSSYYDSANKECFITFDFGQEFVMLLKELHYYPSLNRNIQDFYGFMFQFSQDNVNYINLLVVDKNLNAGWNIFRVGADVPVFRYIRMKSNLTSSSRCNIAEVKFYGVKMFANYLKSPLTSLFCDAKLFSNGFISTLTNAIEYREDLTSFITEIDPKIGPSTGGTVITINGKGFKKDGAATILIDTIPCVQNTVTETTITCTTGARAEFKPSTFELFVDSQPVITNGLRFSYIDRWSDPITWGGEAPPREGDSVYVPPGQSLLVDVSTPELYTIIVEGTLIFEDKDMNFDANFLICMGGRVQIGTFDEPFTKKLIITMHGDKDNSKQLPEFGNKVWGFHHGATLDMHGVPRKTWTLLSKTAKAGESQISLTEVVDWVAGEEIVIASSDFNHNHSESRVIKTVSVDKKVVTLDRALEFTHYSEVERYDGKDFPMQCEVGLLTRNIVYRGHPSEDSVRNKYGAHLMLHSPGCIGRISYTEFTHVGQGTIIGRYPMHFHQVQDASDSFVIGNAVHESYARVVTMHNTHFLRVQKNVGYRIYGHAYFIEDGIETYNVIEDNLAISIIQIWTLINTDVTASAFWVTNPKNILRRNRAAGGDWFGFWYQLENRVTGPSYNPNICPEGMEMGVFTDNVAHSFNAFGLRIYQYVPRVYPCTFHSVYTSDDWYGDNPSIPAVFSNFIAWKNFENGVMAEHLGAVEFRNFLIADSRLSGIQVSQTNFSRPDSALLNGSIIVGKTNNADPDVTRYAGSVGLTTPRTDGFLVKDVSFFNFTSDSDMKAIKSCSKCWHPKLKISGGKITRFSALKFSNVGQRVIWEPKSTKKEIFIDLDGSLTSLNSYYTLLHFHQHLDGISNCRNVSTSIFDESIVCNSGVQVMPIMFANMQPNEAFRGLELKVLRLPSTNLNTFNISLASNDSYHQQIMEKIFVDTKYTWDIPFVTGFRYNIHFQSGNLDWTHMQIYPSQYYQPSDMGIILRFNYSDYREDFSIKQVRWSMKKYNVSKLDSIPIPETNNYQNGDYYHDMDRKMLYVGVNGKTNGTLDLDSIKCFLTCPKDSDNSELENFVRLWSNTSMWPGGVLPALMSTVTIPKSWRVLMDMDPPNLAKLIIDGELIFDSRRTLSTLASYLIWVRQGKILAGTAASPFPNSIKINLLGDRSSDNLIIDSFIETSNKILAVTGAMFLYGVVPDIIWTKLAESISPGQNYLVLIEKIGWKVGDEIIIAPTERAWKEAEKMKIKDISTDGKKITVEQAFKYFHYGESGVTWKEEWISLDMRASVGLLTRNIKITTDPINDHGCNVLVYQYQDVNKTIRRGRVELDGVQISFCGHQDTERAGLDIKYVESWGPMSKFTRSSIHDGLGWCMNVFASKNVTIENNVFYNCEKFAVRGLYSNYFYFKNNLMIGSRQRNLAFSGLYDMVAGLDMYVPVTNATEGANIVIQYNVVQGGDGNGFVLPGGECNSSNTFKYNHVNSVKYIGLIINANQSNCIEMSHFTVSTSDGGLITNVGADSLILRNMLFAENRIGNNANHAREFDENTIIHENLTYIGLARPNCASCYTKSLSCEESLAFNIPVLQIGGKSIPIDKPDPWGFLSICKDSAFDSKLRLSNIKFYNYRLDFSNDSNTNFRACGKNQGHILMQQRFASPDSSTVIYANKVKSYNVDSDSVLRLQEPNPGFLFWRGGCGDFLCTGEKNWFYNDLDGSLLGKISQIIPNNLGIRHPSCVDKISWNARVCDGINFGLLEFQNDGADQRMRLIAPVNVTSNNMKNTLNQWREWKWEGPEPLDKRLARFNGIFELNQTMNLQFEVGVPAEIKMQIQKGLPYLQYSVISIKYERPNTIEVWNMNSKNMIKSFRVDANVNLIEKVNDCGANIFDPDNRLIHFVINNNPDCKLKINTINSVRITVHMETTIDVFFKNTGEASFIDKISAFLKLDMGRIRIVGVRKGSVILDFVITEKKGYSESTNATETFESNKTIATNSSDVDRFLAMKKELTQLASNLTAGLTTGSLNVGYKVTNVTTQMQLTSNITVNETETPRLNAGSDDGKTRNVLLGVFIPLGVVAIGLIAFLCYRNKEYLSKKWESIRVKPKRKDDNDHDTHLGGHELVEQYSRDSPQRDKWRDSLIPEENTNKGHIHDDIIVAKEEKV